MSSPAVESTAFTTETAGATAGEISSPSAVVFLPLFDGTLAQQLVGSARHGQQLSARFLKRLTSKLGAERVTQKLETYWQLDAATLVAEVRRAGASKLTPAAQRLLAEEHARQLAALRPILAKMRQLEIELQRLVFDIYGLTPEEVQLLRSTAPPRDPLALAEAMPPPREDKQ